MQKVAINDLQNKIKRPRTGVRKIPTTDKKAKLKSKGLGELMNFPSMSKM